jgi:hypothetical protein
MTLVVAYIILFKIYSLASIGKLFPNSLAEEKDNQSLIKDLRINSSTRPLEWIPALVPKVNLYSVGH